MMQLVICCRSSYKWPNVLNGMYINTVKIGYFRCCNKKSSNIDNIEPRNVKYETTIQVKASAKLLQINGDERPTNGTPM